jgi:3-oxoacyl-[acyl-carrier protein] reductase
VSGRTLDGKFAIVTGGASGIGRAVAVALAADGAAVAVLDVQDANGTADAIAAAGGQAWAARCDVSREASILAAYDGYRARFGERLDVLVQCAGIQIERPVLTTSAADFDRVFAVNVRGTFLVGREALRMMTAQPSGGRVINVASELAYLGRSLYSVYTASKGAVLTLTRAWAREFAPHVLVNCVAPGPTDTPLLSAATMSPDVLEAEQDIPLRRIARPEEIAATAVFLAGPGGSFYTGACLSPNGGAVMF